MTYPRLILTASCTILLSVPALAAVDFVKDVKPILEQSCVRCHNPKGTDFEDGATDVDLSTKEAAFEAAIAAASLAMRQGHEVHVSVPARNEGKADPAH